ncbi:sugar phosphate nucleotidyltransferase [Thermostaphylospora chromogena]|uniref:sugar phosphate nucleotidyltransferase n=1 Tax=Thermostaphylospora chromogena TaxID=35622 RepID=UPI001F608C9F|nr:NDP-sugar synthase [Thermostaphylospora chromogena]
MTENIPGDLEAILLVGGQGTRLRPLTLGVPKPLLPTAGVPFLAHQLARARAFGVRRVVFATSYRAEMFRPTFGDGEAFGLSLTYVYEEEPLGTGGAIRNAARALTCGPDAPVLVLNGDILSGHDIGEQVRRHVAARAAVTLHLTEVDDPSRFGCVPTDADGRVTAFLEKTPNPVTNRINAGCYVFTRSVIDTIPEGRVVSVERETFPGLIEAGALVLGYATRSYWLDVGTPEAFVQGSRDLVLGRLASPALPAPPGELIVLPGAEVSPEAKVGGGSVVGAGAKVEAGAAVTGSVLGDGCLIAAGATVTDSVVGRGARIAEGVVLRDAVIGDDAEVGPGNELIRGVRVWPGVVLPERAVRFSSDA